jgi:hypothetical protein
MNSSIPVGSRSPNRMATTPRTSTTAACPTAYSDPYHRARRRSSVDPAMSAMAAMWSQSMPCRSPNRNAPTRRPKLNPALPSTTEDSLASNRMLLQLLAIASGGRSDRASEVNAEGGGILRS